MRNIKWLIVVPGIIFLLLSAGFYFRVPSVIQLWPLPDGRLSHSFIASILAGAGVSLVWVGLRGERGALVSYAISFGIMFGAMAIFAFQLYSGNGSQALLLFGIDCVILTALCVGLWLLSRTYPATPTDQRPMPAALRIPLIIEVIVLLGVGISLVLKRPDTLPWPLQPESSVMYGWVFVALAIYYIYPLVRPLWNNAQGQLLGFLAYDVALALPLFSHFSDVRPEHVLSQVVASIIITLSALLAIYFLFINPRTRFGTAAAQPS